MARSMAAKNGSGTCGELGDRVIDAQKVQAHAHQWGVVGDHKASGHDLQLALAGPHQMIILKHLWVDAKALMKGLKIEGSFFSRKDFYVFLRHAIKNPPLSLR